MPCGALDLTIQGKGETPSSIAPNGTFTIQHRILLGFNPAVHSLFLVPKGGPAVSANEMYWLNSSASVRRMSKRSTPFTGCTMPRGFASRICTTISCSSGLNEACSRWLLMSC